MKKKLLIASSVLLVLVFVLSAALLAASAQGDNVSAVDKVYLSDLKWKSYKNEGTYAPWLDDDTSGNGKINLSNLMTFDKGVRTHPNTGEPAYIIYDISSLNAYRFCTYVGPDRNGTTGLIQFKIYVDNKVVYTSQKMSYGMYDYVEVDLTGAKTLKIEENDGGDGNPYDGGSWADAHLLCCNTEGAIGIEPFATDVLLSSTVTLTGHAKADSVDLYANDLPLGNVPVTGGSFSFTGTVPSSVKKNSDVALRADSVVGGEVKKTAIYHVTYLPEFGALTDLVPRMSGDMKKIGLTGVLLPGNTVTSGLTLAKGKSFTLDFAGAEYTLYEGVIGLNQNETTSGKIVLTVTADGKELYKSPVLTGTDTALLRLEIPGGTKTLTFTSTAESGSGTLVFTDGTFYGSQKVKDELTVPALSGASDGKTPLSAAILHASVPSLRGMVLNLGSEEPSGSFCLRVYAFDRGYARSRQNDCVMEASGLYPLGGGKWYVPFTGVLEAGEYVFTFASEKDVNIATGKSSATAVCLDGKAKAGGIDVSFVLEKTGGKLKAVKAGHDDVSVGNHATEAEKSKAEKQYRGWLSDLSTFPASFKIGATSYSGFGSAFKKTSQTVTTDPKNSKIEHTVTVLLHEAEQLEFTIFSEFYPDYAAYEWVIYIENKAEGRSSTISGLYAMDLSFKGENPVVNGNYGDSQQYLPDIRVLGTKEEVYTPVNGRSTQGENPYFNFEYGNEGTLLALGWSGKWRASFKYSADTRNTRVTASQETFSAQLKKGETARTPLVAMVNYEGNDLDRAANLWRHWFLDCAMHQVISEETGEYELFSPAIAAASSVQFHEMTRATDAGIIESIRQYIANSIDISFCWMDAGWYFNTEGKTLDDWGWAATGSWQIDTKRFPSKLSAVSQYGKSVGVKTLLWFEPERFSGTAKTNGYTVKPQNILGGYLVNEGNKETRDWLLNRILTTMNDGNITLYREDFNCDPLPAWRANDGGTRQGMTENLYVQGHLYIWDEILKARPSSMIDSCASGGNRNDLEAIKRAVPLHKTDYSYGDSAAQQCYALMMYEWMPYFGTKADNNDVTYSDRYFLRTALVPFMVLNYDYTSKIDWDIVRDVVDEKNSLDRYIYKDYYRLTPYSRSESAPMAWEFYDPEDKSGYAMVFRRPDAPASTRLVLKGLDADTTYHVWFEDAGNHTTMTGRQLMTLGVTATIPAARSSDILHISTKYDRAPLAASITKVANGGKYLDSIVNDSKEHTYYFDIRLDRSLRSNVLAKGKTMEENVTSSYENSILINGRSIKDINAEKSKCVKLHYDALNNILRVVITQSNPVSFKPTTDNTVTLTEDFKTQSGEGAGKALTFKYAKNGKTWSRSDSPVIHLQLIAPQGTVNVGTKLLLTARVTPFDATDAGVTYTLSDDTLASLDKKGYLTAKKEGTLTVTATAKDGSGCTASLTFTIIPKGEALPEAQKVIATEPYAAPVPETEPPATEKVPEETEPPKKKGCGSAVSALILVPMLAAAVVIGKKKKH